MAALAVAGLVTAGCSSGGGAKNTAAPQVSVSTKPPRPKPTGPNGADAVLIQTMYDAINKAFRTSPDDGVRAIIAAQYPEDSADVGFAQCVNAISPGAKTLPASERLAFVPNIATMTSDPGYTVNSQRVKGLHPKGRIYATKVTIFQGTSTTVNERHQVVLNGKAYQFSTC
jgi:hypothetical protein